MIFSSSQKEKFHLLSSLKKRFSTRPCISAQQNLSSKSPIKFDVPLLGKFNYKLFDNLKKKKNAVISTKFLAENKIDLQDVAVLRRKF